MVDRALGIDTNHTVWPGCAATKSLVEYRRGNCAAAVEWGEKILLRNAQLDQLTYPGDPFSSAAWLKLQTYAVLAMAHFQLKEIDSAHLALKKAQQIADTKLPKLESGDLEEAWVGWVFGHALLREARQLLEENTNKPPASMVTERR